MLIVDLLREKKTSQVLLQLVLPILRKLRRRIELSRCESILIYCVQKPVSITLEGCPKYCVMKTFGSPVLQQNPSDT